MGLIGEKLKKIRERNQISLSTVSKNLNLSVYFLKSIENDDFSKIPVGSYTIAYIRSYAIFLDLNADEIVQLYKDQVSFINKKEAIEINKPIESFNFLLSYKFISFIGVLSLSLSFYLLFVNKNDYFFKYAITPDISENIQAKIEEIELTNALTELKKDKNELLKIETKNLLLVDKDSLKIDTKPSAAIASIENEILDDFITIKSLQPTWIQLRNSKDEIIHSSLMDLKEEYTYSVNDNYMLTTANAGNIMILINGKVQGKLGKKGEVIEKLVISSDFFK